jgi:hypothetical protein
MKPKCTIFTGWTGPECGKDAISRNDYGGFQCEFHDSLERCEDNPIGSYEVIENDSEKLSAAYAQYLESKKPDYKAAPGQVIIPASSAPKSMLNQGGVNARKNKKDAG